MSPKLSMYINIAGIVIGVIATLSPAMFPSYIPDGIVKDIIQTAGLITSIWSGVNTALHAVSSSQPGPLGK